jgi:hypothetical protein
MMTPLAIAHEALESDLNNSHKYAVDDNDTLLYLCKDGDYCTFDHKINNIKFTYISTVQEFKRFKGDACERMTKLGAKLTKKPLFDVPIYTQEMADNCVLPSVGMECLIYYSELDSRYNDFFDVKIKILAVTGDVFTFSNDTLGLGALKLNSKLLKPLTPPIKLENGKAYQFYGTDNKKKLGFYNSSRDKFTNNDYAWKASAVTSIEPLTLEAKS